MVTLLSGANTTTAEPIERSGDDLWLSGDSLARATGFELKPEGFCRDEICIPVPRGRDAEFVRPGAVNATAFWRYRGGPVLHDNAGDTWVLGEPAADRAARLASLEAPGFTLPDMHGKLHSLSDYRGQKVLLAAWASW
jgi:hypothetical protein